MIYERHTVFTFKCGTCSKIRQVHNEKLLAAVKILRRAGWSVQPKFTFCPDCRKYKKERKGL